MSSLKIKINNLSRYPRGTIVNISVDENGIPLDFYWRRRLENSKIDNCLEVISKDFEDQKILEKKKNKKED